MSTPVHVYHQNLLNYAAGRRHPILENCNWELQHKYDNIYSIIGFTEVVGNNDEKMNQTLEGLIKLSLALNENVTKCRAIEVGKTALSRYGEYISIAWDDKMFKALRVGRATVAGKRGEFWHIEDRAVSKKITGAYKFFEESDFILDQRGVAFISGILTKIYAYPVYFHGGNLKPGESEVVFNKNTLICDNIIGGRAVTDSSCIEVISKGGEGIWEDDIMFGDRIVSGDYLLGNHECQIRASGHDNFENPGKQYIVKHAGSKLSVLGEPVHLTSVAGSDVLFLHSNGQRVYKVISKQVPMVFGFVHNVYKVGYPTMVFGHMNQLIAKLQKKYSTKDVIIGGDFNIRARKLKERGMHLIGAVQPHSPEMMKSFDKRPAPSLAREEKSQKKSKLKDELDDEEVGVPKNREGDNDKKYVKTTRAHAYDFWLTSNKFRDENAYIWLQTRRDFPGDGLSDHAGISLKIGEAMP